MDELGAHMIELQRRLDQRKRAAAEQDTRDAAISPTDVMRKLSKFQRTILLWAIDEPPDPHMRWWRGRADLNGWTLHMTRAEVKLRWFKLEQARWTGIGGNIGNPGAHVFRTTNASRSASASLSRTLKRLADRALIHRGTGEIELTALGLRVAQVLRDAKRNG